jgi:hypothetical protein
MLNFYRPFFIPCFGSHFENGRHLEKRRIAPLMVIYHYVKFYVSIIIHLEVININVRNLNFPIGFYTLMHCGNHYYITQNYEKYIIYKI